MEFELGYLLALVVMGLGILGIILALIINEINKSKFIISLILSIIILGLGGYYYYLIGLYQSKAEKTTGSLNRIIRVYRPKLVIPLPEKEEVILPEPTSQKTWVIIDVDDKEMYLKNQAHLKIKKGKKLKIINAIVPGVKKDLIRVNFVGFVGDPKLKGDDRGYEINTTSLMRKYALNKEGSCYKIEVLKRKETVAVVYIDLI